MGQGVLQSPETQASRKVVKPLLNPNLKSHFFCYLKNQNPISPNDRIGFNVVFDYCYLFSSFWEKGGKIVIISLFCVGGVENVYYICMRKPHPHCKYRHFHAWRNIDLLVQKMERNAKK